MHDHNDFGFVKDNPKASWPSRIGRARYTENAIRCTDGRPVVWIDDRQPAYGR